MNYENLGPYIFPVIIILFLGYRFYRFRMIRIKLPLLLKEGAILIDVRSIGEFKQGHNPVSINIPLDELNMESKKIDTTKTILLCCASGTRSAIAIGILKKNGFRKVLNAGPWGNTLVS